MRSVTLSCITFQWMSTRVHWSFQAVGGQTFSPLIFEPAISTSVSVTRPERRVSVWPSVVAKPLFLLLAKRPICLRLPSLSLYQSIICSTSGERRSPSPIFSDRLNELHTLTQSDSCCLCHPSFVSCIVLWPLMSCHDLNLPHTRDKCKDHFMELRTNMRTNTVSLKVFK